MVFLRANELTLNKTEQKLKLLLTNRSNTQLQAAAAGKGQGDSMDFVDENALSVTIRRHAASSGTIPPKSQCISRRSYGLGYTWAVKLK